MNSTYTSQIEAVQKARRVVKFARGTLIRQGEDVVKLDSALSDAGSTIAALNLSDPYKEIADNKIFIESQELTIKNMMLQIAELEKQLAHYADVNQNQ